LIATLTFLLLLAPFFPLANDDEKFQNSEERKRLTSKPAKLYHGMNKKYRPGDEPDMQINITEVEEELSQRRSLVKTTCKKYGHALKIPLKLYKKRLRFDSAHRLMYCENYKIGSSTWASHLLKMAKVAIRPRMQLHLVARKEFPPLVGARKERFLARPGTVSFIIVRDPFERLLSSFKDKMARAHTPNMVTWESFGQEQRIIRKHYRTKRRNGTVPTFKEFVSYLVGELSPSPNSMKRKTRGINEHWKPIYLNCAPCNEDYKVVMKMETLSRDSLYLKQKLNLNIDVEFVRQGGKEGHTTADRAVEAFRDVGPKLVRQLVAVYRVDFAMFGYSPEKYLNIT